MCAYVAKQRHVFRLHYTYILRNGLKPSHFVADEKLRIKKDIEAVVPRSDLEQYCNSWD